MGSHYFKPIDVVDRLYFGLRQSYRFDPPIVELEGEEKKFGKLKFKFIGQGLEYTVYIKDKKHILDTVDAALRNYEDYVEKILEIYR